MPKRIVTRDEYRAMPESTREALKGWLSARDLTPGDVAIDQGVVISADGATATVQVFERDEFGIIRIAGDPWDLQPVTVERSFPLPTSVRAKLNVHARDKD